MLNRPLVKPLKIISGGQTGVDRAALDWAIANGFESGGYVPKGRRAEDGRIPDSYANLIETGSDVADRTKQNVIHSDATLILSEGELSGGSKLTFELAIAHGKPFLHVNFLKLSMPSAVRTVRLWLADIQPGTLNVAGPRASEDAGIYTVTRNFLNDLFTN